MITSTFVLDSRYPDCTLTTYLHDPSPELAIGARRAIIVCPGGGYQALSDREAEPVALHYLAAGLNVFLLRYSIGVHAAEDAPLIQAALAVAHVRQHASDYFVDPEFIFIAGFSAGGHLAACCGAMWQDEKVRAALEERGMPMGINRPTATILCYPVITSGPYGHKSTFDMLCGSAEADQALRDRYSADLHVNAATPPSFIWHTFEDQCVPIQNTLLYAQALAQHGVPFEYHVYPRGPHGLSLATPETWSLHPELVDAHCSTWADLSVDYIKDFRLTE